MSAADNFAGGHPGGSGGHVPMQPPYGFQGMPMGGPGGGQLPFMNAGMSGGPPFMPSGQPMSQLAAAHHVPPGSGSVVLVSNLDAEVSPSYHVLP